MIKTYHELIRLKTFEERFEYLKLNGSVGRCTFGSDRYLNQMLYNSVEWRHFRDSIIIRDNGCDLGIIDREIFMYIVVHHIVPITIDDIERCADCVFDPDNVISTSSGTHRAIHYGDINLLFSMPKERKKGDTCPWKVY